MNKNSKINLLVVIFFILSFGSYIYYRTVRNPITETLDFVSENTIGVDLDPIMDEIQKNINKTSSKIFDHKDIYILI